MKHYNIELEFEHGFIEVVIEYEYEPGSRGSYEDPPEHDDINIRSVKIGTVDLEDFEQFLLQYERDGGGKYNPDDDR